jgi:DNA polymerase-3 subunit epsilon
LIPRTDSKLSDLTFVAFDVETTGLDPQSDRIVEIGAVRFGRDGNLAVYRQLIDPQCQISPEAVAIHGITSEMVASSPTISAAMPSLIDFLGDSILMAHNAPFDIGFFDAVFTDLGIEIPDNPILCTLQLARAMFPGLPGYGLAVLSKEMKLPPGRHHRALADAARAAEVFRRCVEQAGGAWNMTLGRLLGYHGAPFQFGKTRDSEFTAQVLTLIEQAISKKSSVRIDYVSGSGKATTRTISPQSIDDRGEHPKVVAFCHLRGERRTFRLDCITKISQTP